MGTKPVLVIHGVGNRGKQSQFRAQVDALGHNFQGQLDLIDVYWGDLGAEDRYIPLTLPSIAEVRADDGPPRDEDLGLSLLAETEVRDDDAMSLVVEAATQGTEVRNAAAPSDIAVRAAVQAAWPELEWLPRVSDEEVLRRAGGVVQEALAQSVQGSAQGPEVRDEVETRGPVDVVRGVLKRVDDLVGTLVGRVGGELNRALRTKLAPGFSGFFGDIIAYLSGNEQIYQLVWETIRKAAPGYGTENQPIGAIAHSLGGVILFDMAVQQENPLHLEGFVTFGSQSPFFHAIARRSPTIEAFVGQPVALPPTFRGKWVNLWEPLDLLAFVANRVFRLADGSVPDDRTVPHVLESGLWTHSSYWQLPALPEAIRDVFLPTQG